MLERAQIQRTEYYYEDTGSGPPVLFLHGFSGNHLSWWQQFPTFSETYRCIAPDQRRFGLTVDNPDGPGVTAFVDDIVALLDYLEVNRVALVGHSMSGWSATSFMTQFPDRVSALVLSGTPGGLLPSERHMELRESVEGSLPAAHPIPPEQEFLSELISGLNHDAPSTFDDIHPVIEGFPIDSQVISEADTPVYLIAGQADTFMPEMAVKELDSRIRSTNYDIVEGAGHSVHFEKPSIFNQSVKTFLDKNATP